ncbi:lipoprotein [Algimonas porphyrae]|uniref:Lipoprotein n=1 Tax=Algimonas porphyrae TaxID=1128113 RepID=A0ABQ5V0I4_9PROT|nr:lipoprotein [Algimonas porphyrae]GLQ20956.1 hypothetical protein GCM10007854_19110 [Algimonas porphyrae]
MTRLLAVLLLIASSLILSGCGIRGNLQTPPPLWGGDAASETTDADAATVAEAANEEAAAQRAPLEKDNPGYGTQVADQP